MPRDINFIYGDILKHKKYHLQIYFFFKEIFKKKKKLVMVLMLEKKQ